MDDLTSTTSAWITNWNIDPALAHHLRYVFTLDVNDWPIGLSELTTNRQPEPNLILGADDMPVEYLMLDFTGVMEFYCPPPLMVVMDLLMMRSEPITFEILWNHILRYSPMNSRIPVEGIRQAVRVINKALTFLNERQLGIITGEVPTETLEEDVPDTNGMFVADAIFGGILMFELGPLAE